MPVKAAIPYGGFQSINRSINQSIVMTGQCLAKELFTLRDHKYRKGIQTYWNNLQAPSAVDLKKVDKSSRL